jgi:hypothetical protein
MPQHCFKKEHKNMPTLGLNYTFEIIVCLLISYHVSGQCKVSDTHCHLILCFLLLSQQVDQVQSISTKPILQMSEERLTAINPVVYDSRYGGRQQNPKLFTLPY